MYPTNRSLWEEQHEWFVKQLENFHRTLSQRIKKLDATDYKPETQEKAK
jgi:hypothetical protein